MAKKTAKKQHAAVIKRCNIRVLETTFNRFKAAQQAIADETGIKKIQPSDVLDLLIDAKYADVFASKNI